MTRKTSFALALLFGATPSFAIVEWDNQRDPRGFMPDSPVVADGQGSDATSPFSGGVGLTIPIGQPFHVGGGLTWQLSVVYSSSVWRYTAGSGTLVTAALDSDFSAGLGWRLSLGNVYKPSTGANTSTSWVYVSPSGSRHKFFQQLHDADSDGSTNFYYTRDGSYLRLNATSTSSPIVEFPDGTMHTFDTTNSGRITSIKNRFKSGTVYQNVVTIAYPTTSQWTVSDGHRTVTVNLATKNDGKKHVANIVVPTFGNGSHTYTFEYQETTIRRTCFDTDANNNVTPGNASSEEAQVAVPLLRKIDGPYELDWKMLQGSSTTVADYHNGDLRGTPQCSFSGVIESIEYPTKTTTSWSWQKWAFPPVGKEYLDYSIGAKNRTVTSPVGSINPAGVWKYTPSLLGPASGAKEEIQTEVEDPEGSKTYYYFRAPTTTPTPWDYGLPFTKYAAGAGPQDGMYLSQQVYTGTGGAQELTTRIEFTKDPLPASPTGSDNLFVNRRVLGHRTEYKGDGGKYKDVDYSIYDGLGHYRVTTISDNFGSTPSRIERVNWNPDRGCYSDCAGAWAWNDPESTESWVLQVFDYARQDEDGQRVYQDYSFSSAVATLGYLDQVRVRRNVAAAGTDPSQSDADVIVRICPDSRGNTISQRWYGGDTQSIVGATVGCGSGSTSSSQVDSVWSSGTMTKSTYTNANGAPLNFDNFTGVADVKTGLLSRVCDATGYCTNLTYDDAGRLTKAEPQTPSAADAGAVVNFGHNFGSTINQWYTNITLSCPVGSPTPCDATKFPQEKRFFDGFGRLHKVERLNADGTTSKQVSGFSKTGALRSVSEWIPVSMGDLPANTNPDDTATSIAASAYTIFDDRDVFGRPRIVWRPDGKKVKLAYAGIRKADTTVSVATALDGSETEFTTKRTFDRNGRIVLVEEPALAGGALTSTTASYFVGGQLKQIVQSAGAVQTRSYVYDGRGFLQSETIPERTGSATFGLYDALGNPGRRRDGSGLNGVLLTWDRAGRLTQVQQENAGAPGNLIKSFQYDSAVGRGLGKLAVADSYNEFPERGYTYDVRDTYEYQGIAGAPTKKTTGMFASGNPVEQFVTTLATDAAGQVTSIGYPSCTGGWCGSPGAPSRTVWADYSNGWLMNVANLATFAWHPNGMLATVYHSNGVHDGYGINATTYEGKLNDWQSWDTNTSTPLFLSGTFQYDGAGNIEAIGAHRYKYDGVSRLVESSENWGGPPAMQQASFDGFGNIQNITTGGSGLSTSTDPLTNRLLSPVSYDVEGNLTNWNSTVYGYDRLNRLRRFQSGTVDMLFAYDANDERVYSGETANYDHDVFTPRGFDGQVLREYDAGAPGGATANYTDYVWRGRSLLSRVDPVVSGGVRMGETPFAATVDHLDSPRLFTKADGTVAESFNYYPFGQELSASNANASMRYTGHERDGWGTGITTDDVDYMHARSYQPTLARFMQVDPLAGWLGEPQSLNRFSYALDGPINFTDPLGTCVAPEGEFCIDDYTEVTGDYWCDVYLLCSNEGPRAHPELKEFKFPNGGRGFGPPGDDEGPGEEPVEEKGCSIFDSGIECLWKCTKQATGIESLFGAGAVAAGEPTIAKPFITPGSSGGTSIASKGLSKLFPQRMPVSLFAPTRTQLLRGRLGTSKVVGRVAGRWVPYAGAAILLHDAAQILNCVAD